MSTASPFTRKPPAAPTVAQLIRFGAREFDAAGLAYGHGTGDARDDAAALAFHALGLDHADAEAAYALQPEPARRSRRCSTCSASACVRRAPAAYLMGRMWFAGLEFEVDPRVHRAALAIRRTDRGRLRAMARSAARAARSSTWARVRAASRSPVRCGFPQARVDAVDLSPDALDVAARNVERHGVGRAPAAAPRRPVRAAGRRRLRPDRLQSAVRQRCGDGRRCRRNTCTSPTWRCARAAMVSTSCADPARCRCAPRRPGGVLVVEVGDSDERLQQAYPGVPFLWLEFEHGGGGVFLLTKDDLRRHRRELSGAGLGMSGNTFGTLFTVTTFGESHGPALGCIVDGCPPGLAADRGRHPGRCRAPPLRHVEVHQPAPRARRGAHPVGRVRGRDDRHAHRPAGREHRPALVRLRQDQGPLPSRPRRLHLPAEVRLSRLSRWRPLLGPRNRDARGGRRDRAQVPGGEGHRHLRLPGADGRAAGCSARTAATIDGNPFFCAEPGARARTRSDDRGAAPRGRLDRRARQRGRAPGVPPGLGEPVFDRLDADIAHAHDEHQRGQGRGDRRWVSPASSSAGPSIATK